jgi:hypothetical protein
MMNQLRNESFIDTNDLFYLHSYFILLLIGLMLCSGVGLCTRFTSVTFWVLWPRNLVI